MAGLNSDSMAGGRFKRKGSINEDDVSHILHRYTATTILMLLQEVYQAVSSASRIDWKNLVRRTGTGITSPREYQTLWRHLAYREDLLDRIEDGSDPLDIDSDLEFELEADPKPSEDILSESSLCVKLLLNASSNTDIPTPHNNIASNELSTRVPPEKPVRIHRITVDQKSTQLPNPLGSAAEVADAANPAAPPKKKRKQWTKEEDAELVTAVQKLGENWSKIEAELKSERTPHQLQLRWNLIKKKQAVNQKPEVKSAPASWEERKAAQETFSLAVGTFSIRPGANPNTNSPAPQATQGLIQPTPIPIREAAKPTNQGLIQPSPIPDVKSLHPAKPLHPANPIQPHHLNPSLNPNPIIRPQKSTLVPKSAGPVPRPNGPPAVTTPRPNGPSPAVPTPRPNGPSPAGLTPRPSGPTPAGLNPRPTGPSPVGLTPPRPNGPGGPGPARSSLPSPCSSIQAAAFAAGGRIATPITAANLLKAAQSKNVVHIRSSGVSVTSTKPVVAAHSHTTIGVRGPGAGSNLGSSFGMGSGSVVEVDKHGFIEAKKESVVVKGVGNGGKEIIGSKVETVLNGNGNGKEESKEKEKVGL